MICWLHPAGSAVLHDFIHKYNHEFNFNLLRPSTAKIAFLFFSVHPAPISTTHGY